MCGFLSLIPFLLSKHFYTTPYDSVGIFYYTFRNLSVRPCSPFPIDNLSHGISSNFVYILSSGMKGIGLLMGKIRPFFKRVTTLKGFLACYIFAIYDN